jgi:hypothetical protein
MGGFENVFFEKLIIAKPNKKTAELLEPCRF